MHKTQVIPSSLPHFERAVGSGIGPCFQLVLRHARKPRSLPALFWKNIKYAFASRRRGRSEDPRVWNEIGRGLAERGRHEEALACYDRALAIRRDIPQVLGNRGNALRNLGRFDEAETSLREALRLKPDFANHTAISDVCSSMPGAGRKPRRDLRENPGGGTPAKLGWRAASAAPPLEGDGFGLRFLVARP
jgi:tetratricopeptide (TPR) repeat protein